MDKDTNRFKELIGDSMIFFNKDANQQEAHQIRGRVLNHVDNCGCTECKRIRNEQDKTALLRRLGVL